MKKCPYCAEQIQDEAVICKHCGKDLKHKPKKEKRRSPMLGCLIVLIVIVIMIAIASFNLSSSRKKAQEQNLNSITAQPRIAETIFNMPDLMGESYNQIKAVLGEPDEGFTPTELQVSMGIPYSVTYTSPSGIWLTFDYVNANQPIRYFFVSNNGDYGLADLRIATNVNSEKYKIIPQPNLTAGRGYTGLHICDAGYEGDESIPDSMKCRGN